MIEFRLVEEQEARRFLARVCAAERVQPCVLPPLERGDPLHEIDTPDALLFVARTCRGDMRKALTVLEQACAKLDDPIADQDGGFRRMRATDVRVVCRQMTCRDAFDVNVFSNVNRALFFPSSFADLEALRPEDTHLYDSVLHHNLPELLERYPKLRVADEMRLRELLALDRSPRGLNQGENAEKQALVAEEMRALDALAEAGDLWSRADVIERASRFGTVNGSTGDPQQSLGRLCRSLGTTLPCLVARRAIAGKVPNGRLFAVQMDPNGGAGSAMHRRKGKALHIGLTRQVSCCLDVPFYCATVRAVIGALWNRGAPLAAVVRSIELASASSTATGDMQGQTLRRLFADHARTKNPRLPISLAEDPRSPQWLDAMQQRFAECLAAEGYTADSLRAVHAFSCMRLRSSDPDADGFGPGTLERDADGKAVRLASLTVRLNALWRVAEEHGLGKLRRW